MALSWQRARESRVPRKTESGIVVDPAYVELRDGDLFFHYEKQSSRWQAAPYAFARLRMPLASPSVSFRLRPKADGRLGHLAGVMDAASGFSCDAVALPEWRTPEWTTPEWATACRPSNAVAVLADRTGAAYAGSGLAILVLAGGVVSESAHKETGFMFEPDKSYSLALSVEAGLVTAAASDGRKVETVTLRPKVLPERFDQVFVADGDAGVSNSASPGRYVLAIEDFAVEDLVHPVRFDVLPEAMLADGSARRLDRVPLAFYSTPSVDATAIDLATIRLSGVELPAEAGSGRYDCHQRDVDGDGLRDLVCQVDARALLGGAEEKVVSLEGRSTSGRVVRGQQFIRLKP